MIPLALAREYVARGFSVIPLRERDKRPALPAWKPFQTRYPTDAELVEWFGKNPKLNIGIVTGKISGVTVVDFDSDKAWEYATSRGFPESLTVKTAKGRHCYMAYEPGMGNFQKRDDLPGIDLRGDGGYVVAPFSIHPSGFKYIWLGECGARPFLPDWLKINLTAPTAQTKAPIEQIWKGQSEGNRDNSLARLAGVWVKSLSFEDCMVQGRAWNKLNNPPLDEFSIQKTINSIWNKEHKHTDAELSENEIVTIENLLPAFEQLYEHGDTKGLSTGWNEVDQFYTIRKKEWTLLTGIPGHGKTTFMDAVIVNTVNLHQWRWGIFSAENVPFERHYAAYLEKFIRKSFSREPRMTMPEIVRETTRIREHMFFINPNENYFTLDRVLKISSDLIIKRQVDAIVIDPWNEMDHQRPATLSETEYISQSLTKLRRFARQSNVHIFMIAHPTKLVKDRNTGKYPVPTPYDVSGSAAWRNKADNCLSIWYDYERPGETEIHIQKVRFKEVGHPGTAKLTFNSILGTFDEPQLNVREGYQVP